jgi:hypothetical protein
VFEVRARIISSRASQCYSTRTLLRKARPSVDGNSVEKIFALRNSGDLIFTALALVAGLVATRESQSFFRSGHMDSSATSMFVHQSYTLAWVQRLRTELSRSVTERVRSAPADPRPTSPVRSSFPVAISSIAPPALAPHSEAPPPSPPWPWPATRPPSRPFSNPWPLAAPACLVRRQDTAAQNRWPAPQ